MHQKGMAKGGICAEADGLQQKRMFDISGGRPRTLYLGAYVKRDVLLLGPAPSVDIKWRPDTQETFSGAVLSFWQYKSHCDRS